MDTNVQILEPGQYPAIINDIKGLSPNDQKQLQMAYSAQLFDMASVFLWSKTIMMLKYQLGQMGMSFISELLDRPEIDANSNYQDISDEDALRVAEDLGLISSSGAFRLRRAGEIVKHFSSPDINKESYADDNDLSIQPEEALMILRSCVQYVLYKKNVEISLNFKTFRDALLGEPMSRDDDSLQKLATEQYFYKRTGLRVVLGLIRSTNGAQLENVLANANIVIPYLWDDFARQERYQVGRNYAELLEKGRNKAASGLKQVLLKVKGFDYVPEDIRSNAFSKAADSILDAHFGMNNFYTEPVPVANLYKMGTVIPITVFGKCLTAILCVKLGNSYGVSFDAQETASKILRNVTPERWKYYFQECFAYDDRVLYKLQQSSIIKKWYELALTYQFKDQIEQITNQDVKRLLDATVKRGDVAKYAEKLYYDLGYRNKD